MAPRKTKTETTPADIQNAELDRLEGKEPRSERVIPQLDIDHMSREDFDRETRFQVALAVFPQIVGSYGGFEPIGDENHAGATARKAFEYADAFIAQSKKGHADGE